jgi:hypothetical protein
MEDHEIVCIEQSRLARVASALPALPRHFSTPAILVRHYIGVQKTQYALSKHNTRTANDAGQRCRLNELVCNGTLVTSIAHYSQSLALCVVRKLRCAGDVIDLTREHNAVDCRVRQLRCQGGRVAPDNYFGDKSACEVCLCVLLSLGFLIDFVLTRFFFFFWFL